MRFNYQSNISNERGASKMSNPTTISYIFPAPPLLAVPRTVPALPHPNITTISSFANDLSSITNQSIQRNPECILCQKKFQLRDEVFARDKDDYKTFKNLCHRKCLEKAAENEMITTNQFLEFVEQKYLQKIEGQS